MALKWVISFVLLLTPLCWARTYSTNFPLTESPICEGGNWQNGKTAGSGACAGIAGGLLWNDMGTNGTSAFNINGSGVSDGTSVVTGAWGPNQTVTATVKCNASDATAEVELRLRTTIINNNINGYELDMSCGPGFIRFVRWNGPFNNFTILNSAFAGVATGDVIAAAVDSSCNLTVKKNGTLVSGASSTDCTFLTGSPGIGSEQNTPPGTPNGFTFFSATDGVAATPWAGVIAPSRAIDWTKSGLPSTFPNGEITANPWTPPTGRTQCGTAQCVAVTSAAGAATAAQINAAIASAPAKSFVLLPPGNYNLNGANNCFSSTTTCIVMYGNNYVTLRGSGAMATTINLTETNAEFQFGTCCLGGTFGLLNSTSYASGTTNVTLTGISSTSALVPGNLAWFTQCNTGMVGCGTVSTNGAGTTVTASSGQPFKAALVGQTMVINTAPNTPANFTISGVTDATHLTLSTAALCGGVGCGAVPAYVGATAFTDPWPAGPTPIWVCGRDYPQCTQDTNEAGPFNFMQQDVAITAASCTANCGTGNQTWSVTFSPGLYSPDWSSNNTATLNWQNTGGVSIGMGLEDMTIAFAFNKFERVDMEGYGPWMKGVRVIGYPTTSSIQVGQALNWLVTNNYFFGNNFNNLSPNIGEPMVIGSGDGSGLDLNNISVGGLCTWGEGQHAADVTAYKFCRDAQTPDYQVVSLDHGVYDFMHLFEALQSGRLQSDDTHGTHGPFTWFRNYVHGEDPPMILSSNAGLVSADVDNFQRFGNIIANVFGGPKSTAYQGVASNVGNVFEIATTDTLTAASLFRWGNYDVITAAVRWCISASAPCTGSEVPTSLSGNAAAYQNAIPASHNLPCSMFLSSAVGPCVPLLSGGTGLSWYKVCTAWSSFPTGCTSSQTPPYPPVGPELTGGIYPGGLAYDNPAAVAHKNLPIDTNYQNSFAVSGATWSGGVETITVNLSTIDNGSNEHTMGGFRLSGAPSGCLPSSGLSYTGRSDNEILMRSSSRGITNTTITYFLPINPGATNCNVTMLFPDVRQFDERIYQSDGGSSGPPVNAPATIMFMTSNETLEPTRGHLQ